MTPRIVFPDRRASRGDYFITRAAIPTTDLSPSNALGIDPPKIHDVSQMRLDHAADLPVEIRSKLPAVVELSRWLRKEREISFYGDIDFISTEEYRKEDASRALEGERSVVGMAALVIK